MAPLKSTRRLALVVAIVTALVACRERAAQPGAAAFENVRPSPAPPGTTRGVDGSSSPRDGVRATQITVGGGMMAECQWAVATQEAPPACDGHSCARMSDGTVRCWGFNASGQLGDGTTTPRASPATVPGLSSVESIAAGGGHTCAVLADATVRCWGANRYGQLGDGTTQDRPTPVAVRGLADVAALALGSEHSCARLRDGTVRCWGRNPTGQLGDGTRADHFMPVAATGLTRAVQLAVGTQHACAVRDDATLWCWGRNDHRQLADGTEQHHVVPFATPALPGPVAQVAAGDGHTCAALRDGHAACWGWNNSGQLGDGSTVMRAAPAVLPNLAGVVQVALGASRTCARLADGTVWCVTRTTQPQRIEGVSDAVSLVVAGSHACALRGDGTLRCWGRNRAGELGTGALSERSDAVAVVW